MIECYFDFITGELQIIGSSILMFLYYLSETNVLLQVLQAANI